MTYLDNGATSFHKPEGVWRAMRCALENCANPGRGGYTAAMAAAKTVLRCRERAGELFCCDAEHVVFTSNCTHALNIAINTLVKPGAKVVISGFEHNAVTRPLHARKARISVAGRKLFDWEDTLESFERHCKKGWMRRYLPMYPMYSVIFCRWRRWRLFAGGMAYLLL